MADREDHTRNEAAPWSDFDAEAYWKCNYEFVYPEDEQIIGRASDFLIKAYEHRPPATMALDVGAGTNLYPALLMLPWAERIVFTEYAQPNIDWLSDHLAVAPSAWTWQPFWDLVAGRPGYAQLEQPRRRLADSHDIRHLSVFDLPAHTWDLGSMFFVADGITSDEGEFTTAVHTFVRALIPGSPFMMAFMEASVGYDVSGVGFPAVALTADSLRALLRELPISDTQVLRTDNSVRPLRPGYDAMLLVTGFAV